MEMEMEVEMEMEMEIENNNNNININPYERIFILSKKYSHYCNCCNYYRDSTIMKHTFNYNDINDNNIWNRMIELTMVNRNNNVVDNNNNVVSNNIVSNNTVNNIIDNTISVDEFIYYNSFDSQYCHYNLSIEEQKAHLISEFINKYL